MKILLGLLSDLIGRLGPLFFSLVRTYVPIGVGAVFGWLILQGFPVSTSVRDELTKYFITLGATLWYLVARWLEVEGGKRGWRLAVLIGGLMTGIPKPPEYSRAIIEVDEVKAIKMVDGAAGFRVILTDGSEHHVVKTPSRARPASAV